MGALGYKLFPSLAKERDRLVAENNECWTHYKSANADLEELEDKCEALADQLAAKTLECASLEAKLSGMQKPAPLEPTTIKVGTAADVRRIVEQQNFRDEQENSDGIR